MTAPVMSKAGAYRGRRGFVMRGISTPRWTADMSTAAAAGVARGGGVYWPEIGPLNASERAIVRRWVASQVTWLCSRETVLRSAEKNLLALWRIS